MEEVVKSPNDSREYRVIKLENGLTALLISDMKSKSDKLVGDDEEDMEYSESDGDDDDDSEYDDEDGEDFSGEEDEDDSDEGMEEDADDNKRKTSASHRTEKMAAAALCVGVGSFSDPPDIPGLAHFLEHMVFMGSEKYPDENSFDDFTKKHGGSDNASTDCETTVFQFDVHTKYFKEGLDRFAQFFIAPLMKVDSTDREIEAVDSEFQISLTSDDSKKQQFFGSLAREGHPMGKFMWGNSKTLKADPAEKKIDVQGRLHEFQRRMHSAHYMTLAVQSKETLDTLEEWVREIFSKIPNNGLPRPSFVDQTEPFASPKYNKIYKLVPVKDVHLVEITWSLPKLLHHYRVKPLHYLSWQIGHEGKGSILALLKKRCLAVGLYCGNDDSGFELNSTHSCFSVTVNLTEQGYDRVQEVISIIFQYVKMLQMKGPQQRIYEEIQTIENNEFRFQEQTDPVDNVEHISENMQHYPSHEYLTGDQLMFEYNEQVLSEVCNMLTPETANIMVLSKKHEDRCDLVEPWYQTPYLVEDIPQSWREQWKSEEIDKALHLPDPNIYIANDFTMKSGDCEDTLYPVQIIDTPQGKLWYKRDTKFNVPKGFVYFFLISPLVNSSPETLLLLDFFSTILNHNLSETTYAADLAQLSYHFRMDEYGLVLKLSGLNDKLPLLFETIVSFMASFSVTDDLFGVVKEQMIRTYHNQIIKPANLVNDVRLSILQQTKWTAVDRRAAVSTITKEKVLQFADQFMHSLYIEGLVQGNFTSKEASSFFSLLVDKLQPSAVPSESLPQTRVVQLPLDGHVCKISNFNKKDSNSVVTNYYQAAVGDIKRSSLIEWLVMRMEEPAFDVLRTQEQLGYVVFTRVRNTFGILGFSVTINTQATKFSAAHVNSRIDAFLERFTEIVEKMEPSDFNIVVDSLIKLKQGEDWHLEEEVNRNWFEITSRNYVFDRLHKEVDALKVLTKEEVLEFLKEHKLGGNKCRKLSIQVCGTGEQEQHNKPASVNREELGNKQTANPGRNDEMDSTDGKKITCDGAVHPDAQLVNGEVISMETEDTKFSLQFLPPDEGSQKEQNIIDISEFKEKLFVYPFTKLDH